MKLLKCSAVGKAMLIVPVILIAMMFMVAAVHEHGFKPVAISACFVMYLAIAFALIGADS